MGKCKIAQTDLEKCKSTQNTCLSLPKSEKNYVQMCIKNLPKFIKTLPKRMQNFAPTLPKLGHLLSRKCPRVRSIESMPKNVAAAQFCTQLAQILKNDEDLPMAEPKK